MKTLSLNDNVVICFTYPGSILSSVLINIVYSDCLEPIISKDQELLLFYKMNPLKERIKAQTASKLFITAAPQTFSH